MLSTLHIENIAVIEQAEISFDRGFNVLTGETGAAELLRLAEQTKKGASHEST